MKKCGSTADPSKESCCLATGSDKAMDTRPASADAVSPDAGGSAGDKTGSTPNGPPVTAAVTDPWADYPGIPEQFLRNEDNTWKHPPVGNPPPQSSGNTTMDTPAATVPAAVVSDGATSGKPTAPGLLDFESLRVDPQEIENQIRREADRRWHQWEGKNRPRKSTVLKQVRKEFHS